MLNSQELIPLRLDVCLLTKQQDKTTLLRDSVHVILKYCYEVVVLSSVG